MFGVHLRRFAPPKHHLMVPMIRGLISKIIPPNPILYLLFVFI